MVFVKLLDQSHVFSLAVNRFRDVIACYDVHVLVKEGGSTKQGTFSYRCPRISESAKFLSNPELMVLWTPSLLVDKLNLVRFLLSATRTFG
jgi:hypothetical protein